MILLRLISWPYARRHVSRMLLTTAGIVLGVGTFLGMHTANQSVLFALHATVQRIAGATELQVTAGESGFEEAVLERVQAVPEVRVAVPVIEAVVDTLLPGQGNVLVLAVDMTGDRSLRDLALEEGDEAVVDDPLVFLAQPDSLIITREFAARNHLGPNSRVPMRTMAGERWFTVRGIMRSSGLTAAFGGNLAIMDVYAAQVVFGRGRRFDRIDLALHDGVTLADGREAIARALGPGFQVETPASRGGQYDSVLRVYSVTMNITSVFALFIGMFIIYNAFAIAVTQRRSEIGILRALGATRRQVRRLFLAESVTLGLVGSLIGLGLGLLLAKGLASSTARMIEGVYGIAQHVEEVSADFRLLVLSLAMGIATSLVAALLPAQNAARVDPVQALQKGKYQVLSAGETHARRWLALLCLVGAAASLVWAPDGPLFYAGFVLAMLATLLLTPALALWLTRALRPLLSRVRPVEGALAADSLIQAPRRTSATVAALMLSLSMAIGLGGVAVASVESIGDWVATALNPDLFVTASPSLTNRSYLLPASLGDELGRIDGVAEVRPVRTPRIVFRGTPVLLVAVDIAAWAAREPRRIAHGDTATMYERAASGHGVIVSDSLAQMKRLRVGDRLDLPAPSGTLRLPLVGIIQDWSDQQGAIFLDRAVYLDRWRDDRVNTFRVHVASGASAAAVRQAILDRLAPGRRLFVLTNQEVRDYIMGLADQWLAMANAQIAVAVLVAVLGIMNTLTVSILDRRRELGVLQAVGARRWQIRHTIWMEAMSIGLVGLLLGLVLGAIDLQFILVMTHRDISGMLLPYRFPASIALTMVPVILAAAWVAAIGPGEAAVRGSVVQSLEYE